MTDVSRETASLLHPPEVGKFGGYVEDWWHRCGGVDDEYRRPNVKFRVYRRDDGRVVSLEFGGGYGTLGQHAFCFLCGANIDIADEVDDGG